MNKKLWIFVTIVALGILFLSSAFGWFDKGIPVETATVSQGAINEFIDEQAKTRLPETYLVTMPFDARIEAITLTEGATVKEGQPVAQIVSSDLDLSLEQSIAAVNTLQKNIIENADDKLELTAREQSVQFNKSTDATVKAASERVKSGFAKLDFALKNFDRIERLSKSDASSKEQLDTAELQKVQGEVDYRQDQLVYEAMNAIAAATNLMPIMVDQYIARKKLKGDVLEMQKVEAEIRQRQMERDKKRGTMRSPVDGVILTRFVSNERHLASGTPLLEIGKLENMEIEADVLTLDAVGAKVGDPVEIYGPAIGKPSAKGKVSRIYPAGFTKVSSLGVEQQRVKLIVRIDPDDLKHLLAGRRLGIGYRVRVKIMTRQKDTANLVPRSSLFRAVNGDWQVFAVHDGTAKLQKVEVGLMNDEQVEIVNGLAQGEIIVLAPESKLVNGTRVWAKP